MSTFLVWLLLGNYVPLTSNAISVTPQCLEVQPKVAMIVKGDGAAIVIRIGYPKSGDWPKGVMSRLERINREFPTGSITGSLRRADGTQVEVANRESSAAETDFDLALAPSSEFTKGDKFVSMRLCSRSSIASASLLWRRVSK